MKLIIGEAEDNNPIKEGRIFDIICHAHPDLAASLEGDCAELPVEQ